MKLLLTTVLALAFLIMIGCGESSDPASTPEVGSPPTANLHGDNDGHDHSAEDDKNKAAGDDHSGHDH